MSDERGGLVAFLQHQRETVLNAVYGLREDQARVAPTTSSLTLGGLVKHLAYGATNYADLIDGKGPAGQADAYAHYMATFVLTNEESLSGAVSTYRDAAQRTDAILSACDDLGRDVPLANSWGRTSPAPASSRRAMTALHPSIRVTRPTSGCQREVTVY